MRTLVTPALRLLVECCALYLLSVLCLLFGVYQAMQTPLLGGDGVAADLPLLGVMNLYDLALLGVIAFLFARPERREDGYWVGLAALFLCLDPSFFAVRMFAHDPSYGLAVNGASLGLAGLKILALGALCKVPLCRSSTRSFLLAAAFVHLAPYPFELSVGQASPAVYLGLWTTLLALAMLSPAAAELEISADDPVEVASVRAREFRFMATLMPFAAVGYHLFRLGSHYGLELGASHLAMLLLAAAMVRARLYPGLPQEDGSDMTVLKLGTASLFFAFWNSPGFSTWALGPELTPLRVLLLGHVLVSSYLALRDRTTAYRGWALTTLLLTGAGATPEAIFANLVGPYGWLAAVVVTGILHAWARTLATALVHWTTIAGAVASLVTGEPASDLAVQLTGSGMLAILHLYPEQNRELESQATWGILLLLGHVALWPPSVIGSLADGAYLGLVGVEVLALLAAAALTPFPRYRIGAGLVGLGACVKLRLLEWLGEHQAGLCLIGAFGFLGAGAWLSANRDLLDKPAEPDLQDAAVPMVLLRPDRPEGQFTRPTR